MKRLLVLTALLAVFLCGCGIKDHVLEPAGGSLQGAEAGSNNENDTEAVTEKRIFVYVCGAVQNAGVYSLTEGSRVFEALEMAGGFSEDADREQLNLAMELTDGQMLRILSQEEAAKAEVEAAPQGALSAGAEDMSDGLVNINTANEELLMTLPGIGQARAEEIIAWRNEHGSFEDISQLRQVSGIGEKIFSK